MSFRTHNVKTAGLSYLFSLALNFFLILVIQFSECISCIDDFFIIGFRITCSFFNKLLCKALLTHCGFCHILCVTAEDDIGTTTCHVGCDCYRTELTCLSNNFSLFFMLFCIEDIVLDASLFDKDRLSLFVSLNNCINNSVELAVFCLINRIGEVFS